MISQNKAKAEKTINTKPIKRLNFIEHKLNIG